MASSRTACGAELVWKEKNEDRIVEVDERRSLRRRQERDELAWTHQPIGM
jgi:hypothetical protein